MLTAIIQFYKLLEKPDMERYWINEVMTVVTCGRILAENIEKDCQLDTLRKYLPFGNGKYDLST